MKCCPYHLHCCPYHSRGLSFWRMNLVLCLVCHEIICPRQVELSTSWASSGSACSMFIPTGMNDGFIFALVPWFPILLYNASQ